jgi:hypothetical protein
MFAYIISVKDYLLDSLFLSRRGEEAQKYKAEWPQQSMTRSWTHFSQQDLTRNYAITCTCLMALLYTLNLKRNFFLFQRARKIHHPLKSLMTTVLCSFSSCGSSLFSIASEQQSHCIYHNCKFKSLF